MEISMNRGPKAPASFTATLQQVGCCKAKKCSSEKISKSIQKLRVAFQLHFSDNKKSVLVTYSTQAQKSLTLSQRRH